MAGHSLPLSIPMSRPNTPFRLLLWGVATVYLSASHALAESASRSGLSATAREAVLADAADGTLDGCDLISASIAISHAKDDEELKSYVDQFQSFSRRLDRHLTFFAGSHEQRAAAILEFLHRRVLIGDYDAGCSDMRRTFDDGIYNCVTATILFHELAQQQGLNVVPVAFPAHVRCQLISPDGAVIEIETTSRHGMYVAAASAEPSRRLSTVELLAKLVYNQGLHLLEKREFEPALEATETSWQLDPAHQSARENVAVVVNNWSLDLSGKGEYRQAVQLLLQGTSIQPQQPLLRSNLTHIYLRWINDLEQQQRSAEAETVLREALQRLPDYGAAFLKN